MATQPTPRLTPAEYLALERGHQLRHEYLAGDMYAMSGASRNHNHIVRNLIMNLGPQLRGGPCDIYVNDMRVRVGSQAYFYPNAVIACGEQKFLDAQIDTLLNPTVVIEVLSPSTERFDCGRKFTLYQQLESLQEYLLIDSTRMNIQHFVRQADGKWIFDEHDEPSATIELPSVGCRLSLAESYDKVVFEAGLD